MEIQALVVFEKDKLAIIYSWNYASSIILIMMAMDVIKMCVRLQRISMQAYQNV